ncbi:MAG TPA: alpha/beta fold hydrolase [Armatimonadota bacterium]|nr:alpha/beta fold hydrolase [Armatimonadota bacterium]
MTTALPEHTAIAEDLVCFGVGEKSTLPVYGIIHRPFPTNPRKPDARKTVGVVLLGGWSGTRVGPHGILVSMARVLAAAGFPALRFDFRGRGDSGGEQRSAHIGTMVEDTRAAAQYLREKTGVESILLIGICAGAQVALGAAPGISALSGMALWSPPPLHPDPVPASDSGATAPTVRSTRSKRRLISLLKVYGARLFDSRTWAKLAHGQLQPRTILRVLKGGDARKLRGASAGSTAETDWAGPKPDERTYELALSTLTTPALFVYGGADPERQESIDYYARVGAAFVEHARIHVVEGSNHAFYSLAWKREVVRETLVWIQELCSESCT